jgi:catechol 2,3-dioxygenase-like lactoylglutathione lyase family enzyme
MATVSVRYIVQDVDAAIAFYTRHLGFHEEMGPPSSRSAFCFRPGSWCG